MYSRHAPNRNPAEFSFCVVDGRLTFAQRKMMQELNKCYSIDSYWVEGQYPSAIVELYDLDLTIGQVNAKGDFYPKGTKEK